MIIDQSRNAWVWDPWVDNNPKLLTINEWMHAADEPSPNSAMITGSFNLINPDTKAEHYLPHFTTEANSENIKIFQSLFANAEPTSSNFPLKSSLVVEDEIRMMEQMDISLGSIPISTLPMQELTSTFSGKKRKADDSEQLETNSSLTSFAGSMFKKIKRVIEPDRSMKCSQIRSGSTPA